MFYNLNISKSFEVDIKLQDATIVSNGDNDFMLFHSP